MTWKPIETAPTKNTVGHRGPMILGCDADGAIRKTFFMNDHNKGDGWLCSYEYGEERYLMQWEPILWIDLPVKFQDKDGKSYEARKMLELDD